MKALPSQSYLKACFAYDSDTGLLSWKKRPAKQGKTSHGGRIFSSRYASNEIKTKFEGRNTNYYQVRLDGINHLVHRLVYKIIHGVDPLIIDHKDGNGQNNKEDNIRSVSSSENSKNQKLNVKNKFGCMGVRKRSSGRSWEARIVSSGKEFHLGSFECYEDAVKARKEAEVIHCFNENHGRISQQ